MGGNLQFFNLTSGASGGVTNVTATPPLTSTGGTTPDISTSMNTNRLIGRSSAGVGVMEEIEVGDGLELALGVLTNTATPTPTGYYGAWYDNQNQSANANDVGVAMIFRETDLSNGVSIVSNGTNLTRITFAHTGIYNLQFSSQYVNSDNAEHYVTIWLKKNGNDVDNTSSVVTIPKRKDSNIFGHLIASWNFVFEAIGGDYYELFWSTNDFTQIEMEFLPATAYAPLTPSVILTVTQQAGIMAGTGITALNGLTTDVQTFDTGTTGTDFNIVSSGSTHTFNIPSASNLARGLVSIIAQTFAGVKTFLSAPILDSLTASRILATDGSKAVQSLDTTTYPDLTELSYVKGVTSAIQTQLNGKQSTLVSGTNIKTINGDTILGSGNELVFNYDRSRFGYEAFTDFITPITASNGVDGTAYTAFFSGTGTGIAPSGVPSVRDTNQQGFIEPRTGSQLNGYAGVYGTTTGSAFTAIGGGVISFSTSIFIPTLSTSSERYRIVLGFGTSALNQSDPTGIIFTYDEGGTQNGTSASPNWQCVTSVSNVRTLTLTSVPASTTAWQKFGIEINATGTSVDFYIDNVLVATHTTNIPTGISQLVTTKIQIAKSIGTTARNFFADYFGYKQTYTTPRI